jgi:hypothetical protein
MIQLSHLTGVDRDIRKFQIQRFILDHPHVHNKIIAEKFACSTGVINDFRRIRRPKRQWLSARDSRIQRYIRTHPALSFPAIANKLSYSDYLIRSIAKSIGITRPRKKHTSQLEWDTRKEFLLQDHSMAEAAKVFGISQGRIRQISHQIAWEYIMTILKYRMGIKNTI